ncbi:hypothetical protein GIB67_027123 [Kingdonia uniflora]|uniref:Molybdopterin synthase catalytic subunit n=1 Tax=Kingdonia uniflora TaxID=39325 RepID=A0A7J7P2N3_9MAGN|nr:hypothetical protein GIB67_027123 [Kingdonia uniflora]
MEKMNDVDEKTLIEILEENTLIDLAKYINSVSTPQAGAIATFSGTTRDTFEGKTVVELRYEAYVPMAIRCIKSICSTARSTWDLDKIAVAHRLGRVPVGETSVFIAISSVHRDDALDACKYVIDEIKALVPIWKKEVYGNGEVWKENKEFLERKFEPGSLGAQDNCGSAAKVKKAHDRKGCCGSKVKVLCEEMTHVSSDDEVYKHFV